MNLPQKIRLLFAVTVADTLIFLQNQVSFFQEKGFEIDVVTGSAERGRSFDFEENVPIHWISMSRSINPLNDFRALVKMIKLISKLKPHIVHASTPKAAFLALIAARLVKVPVRIYTLRGIRYEGDQGSKRSFLKLIEKITCYASHVVLATSQYTKQKIINDKICKRDKLFVLNHGTANGIDYTGRFNPENYHGSRTDIRQSLGIPHSAVVLIFVGRIVNEKGLSEVAKAWKCLSDHSCDLWLVIIGEEESHDPIDAHTRDILYGDKKILKLGYIKNAKLPSYLAMADIFIFPSYREGFGIAPLEASAMRLPAIVANNGGLPEAVIHNQTGLVVPSRSHEALADAINRLISNEKLRLWLGQNARSRVERDFDPNDILNDQYEVYTHHLHKVQPNKIR